MKKGKFIVFEGLDGAGQGTQIKLLEQYLQSKNENVYVTSEPTQNLIGGLIRSLLRHHWSLGNTGIQLLYSADRAHHLEVEIDPIREKGHHVISGRYFFSTIAFGSITNDVKWLQAISEKFPNPDVTIFLKVSPKECIRRINSGRPLKELFEKEKILEKVYKTYLRLVRDTRYKNVYVVNGERPIEEVADDIQKIISKHI
jgi:dTMP kinase